MSSARRRIQGPWWRPLVAHLGVDAHQSETTRDPLRVNDDRFIICCGEGEVAFRGAAGHLNRRELGKENSVLEPRVRHGMVSAGESDFVSWRAAGRVGGLACE